MVPTGDTASKAVWTYGDVAEYLKCSEETVRKRVASGTIPHAKIGRLVRFDPNDVREWFDAQKQGEAA